ncbi:hypothetical protein [Idiomarina sp. HP20-50]|uniref:hypothetical protein n=1 Tax=Idiomarina sp. HP20-50 TaxID=3070813 RepID=UPI00294AE3DF|nr:hypothetical protein [Idiomarina sp. HP20-50]MDV6316241.1 hypothetical protein [Idiomarina sp. HP20-50]
MCKNGILRVKRAQEFTTAKDFRDEFRCVAWWRYQYAHRYVIQTLLRLKKWESESIATFKWLETVAYKYGIIEKRENLTRSHYTAALLEMANCLVYSYHKRNQVDAEVNPVYEKLVAGYGFLFDRLHSDEVKTVKVLHDLTMELGFLVIPFYLEPDKETSWMAFVERNGDELSRIRRSRLYPYPRYHLKVRGVDIVYAAHEREVTDNWDMIVYYGEKSKVGELKDQIEDRWEQESPVEIGNPLAHKFRMYVNRPSCSRRYVLKYLKAGIIGLAPLNCEGFFPLIDEEKPRGRAIKREQRHPYKANIKKIIGSEPKLVHKKTQYKKIEQWSRKINRENQQYSDALRLTDEALTQYLSLEQSNVRRAIGLRIWDRVAESRSESLSQEVDSKDLKSSVAKHTKAPGKNDTVGGIISSLIKELAETHPELLEYYRKDWNSGDSAASAQTIMSTLKKRMRRDYQMTEYCIAQKGFFSTYESTRGSK